jgi:acetyltransferase-like isoleucine patch superfamily enzyme
MSSLRKLAAIVRNPKATIEIHPSAYLGPGFSLHMPAGGTFIAGPNVDFRRGFRAEIGPNGRVVIGAGSYLTYDVIIACDTLVEIGERCGLAQATFIADGSHKFRDLDKPFLEQGFDYRPVRLADDVQVHSKVTILNDIGTRSVIGANAVISRPIPAYCLAAGVPARVLDYFGPPGEEPEGFEAEAASQASRK